jgi:hypothetical protein
VTIAVAYLREQGLAQELIVASDSRLSGGESWDECQKVFPLTRGDAALAFAGAYYRFYPIFCQLVNFCDLHVRLYSRAEPLELLAHKLEQVTEHMLGAVGDHPTGALHPDGNFTFFLCGWDWQSGQPFLRKYSYSDATGRIVRHNAQWRANTTPGRRACFIGDCVPQVKERYFRATPPGTLLDVQPLSAIQQAIASGTVRTIGGSVQGVKLYRHLNVRPLLVRQGERRAVHGRLLFPWEEVDYEVAAVDL